MSAQALFNSNSRRDIECDFVRFPNSWVVVSCTRQGTNIGLVTKHSAQKWRFFSEWTSDKKYVTYQICGEVAGSFFGNSDTDDSETDDSASPLTPEGILLVLGPEDIMGLWARYFDMTMGESHGVMCPVCELFLPEVADERVFDEGMKWLQKKLGRDRYELDCRIDFYTSPAVRDMCVPEIRARRRWIYAHTEVIRELPRVWHAARNPWKDPERVRARIMGVKGANRGEDYPESRSYDPDPQDRLYILFKCLSRLTAPMVAPTT